MFWAEAFTQGSGLSTNVQKIHDISVVAGVMSEMRRCFATFKDAWSNGRDWQMQVVSRDGEAICLLKQIKLIILNIALNKSSYIAFNIQYILHVFTNRCAYSWLVFCRYMTLKTVEFFIDVLPLWCHGCSAQQVVERDDLLEVKTHLSTCDRRSVKVYTDTTAPNTNVNTHTFVLSF